MNSLQAEWDERMRLHAEAHKLFAESNKLHVEADKLYAEAAKFRAEGAKLRAEGAKLWADAVFAKFGDVRLKWCGWHEDKHSYECHLENGEVYVP